MVRRTTFNRSARVLLVATLSAVTALLYGSPLAPDPGGARAAAPAVLGGALANPYTPFTHDTGPVGVNPAPLSFMSGDPERPLVVGGRWKVTEQPPGPGGTAAQPGAVGTVDPGPPNTAPVFVFQAQAQGNIDNDATFDYWSVSSDSRTLAPTADAKGNVASGEPANDLNDVNRSVNLATGNYYLEQGLPAVSGKGPVLQLRLSYNSQDTQPHPPLVFGPGWQTNWTVQLLPDPTSGNVTVVTEEGRLDLYTPLVGGAYRPPLGQFAQLTKNADNSFDLLRKDRSDLHFSQQGRLLLDSDRNGNRLTFNYSALGQLVGVVDASGRADTIAYGPTGQPLSVTDQLARVTQFGYDPSGRLAAITDPAGETTTYQYDAGGRLSRVADPRGDAMTNVYDSQARVMQQTDALNNARSISYGTGQTTVTDPRGCAETSFFDVFFRLTQRSDCLTGGTTRYAYDASGRLTTETDPLGHITTITWDGQGNPLSWQDAAGDRATFTYDTQGNLAQSSDARSSVTSYTYDANGNRTSTTDPLGGITRNFFDVFGELSQVTDPRNNSWSLTYDANGDVTTAADPLHNEATFTYYGGGRLLTTVDPLGNSTRYAYDAVDRLTSVSDPLGHVDAYIYDAGGNLVRWTDANNHGRVYAYDTLDRLVSATDPAGGLTTYGYDASGNVVRWTDANGHATTYQYDQLGRLVGVTDQLGRTTTYQYNANGGKIYIGRNDGTVQQITLDPVGRPTQVTYPSSSVSLSYDADGNRIGMMDASGTTAYTYDPLGRDVQVTVNPGPTQSSVAYQYDAAGNRTRVTNPDGKQVQYQYDAAGRLVQLTDWLSRTATYGYDADGRPISLTRGGGTVSAYSYDAASGLTGIAQPGGNLSYALDLVGNALSRAQGTLTYTYQYDALDRLTNVRYGEGDCQQYSYDSVGNRISLTTYPPGPCVTPSGTTAYNYDAADQLQNAGMQPFFFDKNGNQIGKGNDLYVYDAENRLVAIHGQPPNPSGVGSSCADLDGDGQTTIIDLSIMAGAFLSQRGQAGFPFQADLDWDGAITIIDLSIEAARFLQPCRGFQGSSSYNGDGLRVSKTENGQTTTYTNDIVPAPYVPVASALWSKHSEDMAVLQDSLGDTYERGLGNTIILQDWPVTQGFYLEDALDSAIGMVDPTGAVIATDRYDVYGAVRASTGAVKVKFPWLGLEGDGSGNLSDWARVYQPDIGRATGIGEIYGNDVIVSFEHGDARRPYVIGGLWNGNDNPASATTIVDKLVRNQAGTFMHELGHNFGLGHGGVLPHYGVFGHSVTGLPLEKDWAAIRALLTARIPIHNPEWTDLAPADPVPPCVWCALFD